MLAKIVLCAGTDRVSVGKIPELIATARHPELPADTPRLVTQLKKMPLTEDGVLRSCGVGVRAFPVSITDDELKSLGMGCWANLPLLELPIAVDRWAPYLDAFNQAPPVDWALLPMTLDPALLQQVSWHETVREYEKEIRTAAMNGKLVARSTLTFLPAPHATGDSLLNCMVTIAEFTEFVASYQFGVEFTEAALVAPDSPSSLLESIPDCYLPLDAAAALLAHKQWGDDASESAALGVLKHLHVTAGACTSVGAVRALTELEIQRNIDVLLAANKIPLYSPVTLAPTLNQVGALLRDSELVALLGAGAHLTDTGSSSVTLDETGLSKRERQMRAIEAAVLVLGYAALTIPTGGKKKLMVECKAMSKELFGVGDDPFLDAWKEALKQKRVKTEGHEKYVSR